MLGRHHTLNCISSTSLPFFETESLFLAQISLHILKSTDSPTSASQVPGTTGLHQHAWLSFYIIVSTPVLIATMCYLYIN